MIAFSPQPNVETKDVTSLFLPPQRVRSHASERFRATMNIPLIYVCICILLTGSLSGCVSLGSREPNTRQWADLLESIPLGTSYADMSKSLRTRVRQEPPRRISTTDIALWAFVDPSSKEFASLAIYRQLPHGILLKLGDGDSFISLYAEEGTFGDGTVLVFFDSATAYKGYLVHSSYLGSRDSRERHDAEVQAYRNLVLPRFKQSNEAFGQRMGVP